MGLAKRNASKQGTSQRLIFILTYLYWKFFTAHPQDTNEGSPPALHKVIASLVTVQMTLEKVGESWLCLLR